LPDAHAAFTMLDALSSAIEPWKLMRLPTPGASVTLDPFIMKRSLPAASPAVPSLLLLPPRTELFAKVELPVTVSEPPLRTKIAPP
jgi:hypothetical protein